MTPARHQSGETDIKGRISRCGDEFARTALYEAGHTLLVRSTKWSSLRAWGMEVARRRSMARARVAVARKLGVILHRMWRDGADFRFGKAPTAAGDFYLPFRGWSERKLGGWRLGILSRVRLASRDRGPGAFALRR